MHRKDPLSFDQSALERPLIALTIAGFDPGSGAGVTADLATFGAHGLFGTSALTALTVQSTTGVRAVQALDAAWLTATLQCLADDLPPATVKIGMLGSAAMVRATAAFVRGLPPGVPVVLDPVLVSSSGARLLAADALDALCHELIPAVGWITPNHAELHALRLTLAPSGGNHDDLAAVGTHWPHLHVVSTGGDAPRADSAGATDTLWLPGGDVRTFRAERVITRHTHGTGCAFSAALAANLALGSDPVQAVTLAKEYVTRALRAAPGLGAGHGPMGLRTAATIDPGCC